MRKKQPQINCPFFTTWNGFQTACARCSGPPRRWPKKSHGGTARKADRDFSLRSLFRIRPAAHRTGRFRVGIKAACLFNRQVYYNTKSVRGWPRRDGVLMEIPGDGWNDNYRKDHGQTFGPETCSTGRKYMGGCGYSHDPRCLRPRHHRHIS